MISTLFFVIILKSTMFLTSVNVLILMQFIFSTKNNIDQVRVRMNPLNVIMDELQTDI